MYNGSYYPEILSGSGYVMSKSAAQCLFQEGLKLPYFHLEDVFVTGFAAQICHSQKIHNNGFHPYKEKRHRVNKSKDILYHYIDLHQKDFYFKKFVSKGVNFTIVIVIFSVTVLFLVILSFLLCKL